MFQGLLQEVGWDSEKPGYDGLIELAKALMMNSRSNSQTQDAAVFQYKLLHISVFPHCFFLNLISGTVVIVLSWTRQVRILKSLFPPFLLELYKILIAPIDGGKVAALMVGELNLHWRLVFLRYLLLEIV